VDTADIAARAASFACGASEYERLRPQFPSRLFDDLYSYAGGRMAGRILEVGAGTGRATVPLAGRGAVIDVVEPSADMLRVLGKRLQAEALTDRAKVHQATFEDADPSARYDVVVAAQSFHWTDPATRWTRLGSLLGSRGVAFLFWNGWHLDGTRHDAEAIRAVYGAHGDGLVSDIDDHRSTIGWAEREIEADPTLALTGSASYQWGDALPIDDYLGLLSTTSQYATACLDTRNRLFSHLSGVIGPTAHLNGRTLMLVVETHATPPSGQADR
jgi:SAM-dependent methyltransferase